VSSPLPPVPGPLSTDKQGRLTPPWQAWFLQLYNYLSSPASGGGGIVPNTRNVNTTAPLTGGGNLGADLTLGVNTFGSTNSGVVPASGGSSSTFLAGDGTWQVVSAATGPAGPAGAQGSPGVATYLEGDIGEQGDLGPPGPPGPQGNPGVGVQGPAGPAVFLEAEMIEGDLGPPGIQGIQGIQGAVGANGPPGPAIFLEAEMVEGDIGPPGLNGTNGTNGVTGSPGPAGPAIFLEAEMVEGDIGPPGVFPSNPNIGNATGSSLTITGQLLVGTAVTSSGQIYLVPTTALQYQFFMQGTNTFAGNPYGMYINPNINGTSATTTMYGLVVTPIFAPQTSAAVTQQYAVIGNPYQNSSVQPTNMTAFRAFTTLSANALTGTISSIFSFLADSPSINASATANITNAYGVYSQNIAKGTAQTITNAYAYYGNQGTTGATNNWNLYMAGAASNYMAATTYVGSTTLPADLTTNTTGLIAGAHQSASMTVSAPTSGTAVTIFAIPANPTGVYLIQATLSAVINAPAYTVVGILVTNGASYKWTNIVTATNMTVQISGSNLQATQSSGAAQTITATATRFA